MRKKKLLVIGALILGLSGLTGCVLEDEATVVNQNITKNADNFNTVREVTVINCIQGDVLFQMRGIMSINADTTDHQLEIIVKDGDTYRKHFIGLSDNVTYVIEDVSDGKNVSDCKFKITYNPKMWIPAEVETITD